MKNIKNIFVSIIFLMQGWSSITSMDNNPIKIYVEIDRYSSKGNSEDVTYYYSNPLYPDLDPYLIDEITEEVFPQSTQNCHENSYDTMYEIPEESFNILNNKQFSTDLDYLDVDIECKKKINEIAQKLILFKKDQIYNTKKKDKLLNCLKKTVLSLSKLLIKSKTEKEKREIKRLQKKALRIQKKLIFKNNRSNDNKDK